MIAIKSSKEIVKMQRAGAITAEAILAAGEAIKPGMTTYEIDKVVHRYITSHGAKPSFLGYGGFPGSACVSVNDVVIHGIPGPLKVHEGDIVSVDVGAYIDGYHGDSCKTFAVGDISDAAKALMKSTEESLYLAIEMAKPGVRLGDLGAA
ncbi:MAG: M24 family metallopeptidase, partial [Ruminococcus sp.]|nr:M24 family metallopeptidase [Ruminococcus sp.]